jgi:hypothetical protein
MVKFGPNVRAGFIDAPEIGLPHSPASAQGPVIAPPLLPWLSTLKLKLLADVRVGSKASFHNSPRHVRCSSNRYVD